MASTRNRTRRTVSNTRTGSNATKIQRQINRDYEVLARDYGKLALELWRKPMVKFIVGGIALSAVAPLLMRAYRRYPEIEGFIRENVLRSRDVDFDSLNA